MATDSSANQWHTQVVPDYKRLQLMKIEYNAKALVFVFFGARPLHQHGTFTEQKALECNSRRLIARSPFIPSLIIYLGRSHSKWRIRFTSCNTARVVCCHAFSSFRNGNHRIRKEPDGVILVAVCPKQQFIVTNESTVGRILSFWLCDCFHESQQIYRFEIRSCVPNLKHDEVPSTWNSKRKLTKGGRENLCAPTESLRLRITDKMTVNGERRDEYERIALYCMACKCACVSRNLKRLRTAQLEIGHFAKPSVSFNSALMPRWC